MVIYLKFQRSKQITLICYTFDTPVIQVVGAEYSNAPKPVDFLFGEKYGIDLRADGGQVYFPLGTLSDHRHKSFTAYSCQNSLLYVSMTSSF